MRSRLIEILFYRGDVSIARLGIGGVTRQTAALRELDRDHQDLGDQQGPNLFSIRELINLDLLQPPQWNLLSSE